MTEYSPPGIPIKLHVIDVSEEDVTMQDVLPTITVGEDPKFDPVKSNDVAPDAEAGETEVTSGVEAVENV